MDTKTLGHTRNICQCLEGYYDGIYTSNDAKTCSLCHYSCKKCLNTSDATHCIECDTLIHRTANSGTDSGGNGLIRTKT